jgi:3'-phosphoadenosine 5'-phosphosulfate sulfotransferase (PAPS reductase)/FAD synthetase
MDYFIQDNNILWTPMTKQGTPPAWQPGVEYKIGDVIVPSNPQSGQENLMFMCVGFMGRSGTSQPGSLPLVAGIDVTDGQIKWKSRLAESDPAKLPYDEYALITETLNVTQG